MNAVTAVACALLIATAIRADSLPGWVYPAIILMAMTTAILDDSRRR